MIPSSEELLRTALEAAYPERGAALFREVRRWFDDSRAARTPALVVPDSGERPCVLCDRPAAAMLALVRMTPGTKRLKPRFQIPGANAPLEAPTHALHACSACLDGYAGRIAEYGPEPAKWPHPDMVRTETQRALAADGSEAAAALAREIDVRSGRSAPRRAGTVTCAVCGKKRIAIAGPRGRVCLDCIAEARRTLADLVALFSRPR